MYRFALLFICMIQFSGAAAQPLLHHLIREPQDTSQPAPLLLLLHGIGSNEEDLFSFASQLPPNYLVVSARAPITLSPGSYAWYQVDFSSGKPVIQPEQELAARSLLTRFIAELQTKHKIDKSRIYLCGFSQGAIMSLSVALTNPELVKGAAILSGRLLPEVKAHLPLKEKPRQRFFISHGTQDPTLPVQGAREAKGYLESRAIQVEYHEYPAGHTVTAEMLRDLIVWLKSDAGH